MGVIYSHQPLGTEEDEGSDIRIQIDKENGQAMIEMESAYGEAQAIIAKADNSEFFEWLVAGEEIFLKLGGRQVDMKIEPR